MSGSSFNIIRDRKLNRKKRKYPTQMVSSNGIGKLFLRKKSTDFTNIPPFMREDGVGTVG
jgi:hypothetical protein